MIFPSKLSVKLSNSLLKKADGTKFGKTESGNVWLDPKKTSPYAFYQFWLNSSDADAETFIRIFTLKEKEEIETLVAQHAQAPHERNLQKALAKEVTIRVHSESEYNQSLEASEILFGKGTTEMLMKLDENMLLSVFEGVPQSNISKSVIENKISIVDFLTDSTGIVPSKGEARRMLKDNGVSVNKQKVNEDYQICLSDLINQRYILVQKGKKNYFLVKAE